jgi:sugar lactone lactonase YvrE
MTDNKCNGGALPSASKLCIPTDVALDGSGNLWVVDTGNNRVLRFNAPLFTGESASIVIGQTSFTARMCNQGFSPTPTAGRLCTPTGDTIDGAGDLWVVDDGNNRVLEFHAPFTTTLGQAANEVIGQPGFTTKACGTTVSTLCMPTGAAIDHEGDLWVADFGNSRVLEFWFEESNGESASRVIGQVGFTTSTCTGGEFSVSASATGLCLPTGVTIDAANDVWVADFSNNRVLEFWWPGSNGPAATEVMGQRDFTSHVCKGGGLGAVASQTGLCQPTDSSFDNSGNLWIVDMFNSRVLKFSGEQD